MAVSRGTRSCPAALAEFLPLARACVFHRLEPRLGRAARRCSMLYATENTARHPRPEAESQEYCGFVSFCAAVAA